MTYNEKMPYKKGISLKVDWKTGMHYAVQYLLALQHEKIGLVVTGTRYPSLRVRYEAFAEELAHFGFQPDESLMATSPESKDGAYNAGLVLTQQLLERRPDVSAIIYGTDLMAVGGMEALQRNEYSVPRDISVIGFDDTERGRVMYPHLTSVGVDYNVLATCMMGAMEGPAGRCFPHAGTESETGTC